MKQRTKATIVLLIFSFLYTGSFTQESVQEKNGNFLLNPI